MSIPRSFLYVIYFLILRNYYDQYSSFLFSFERSPRDFLSFSVSSVLLHQDVTHGLGVSFSIVRIGTGNVSTSVGVIRFPSCTKPDS